MVLAQEAGLWAHVTPVPGLPTKLTPAAAFAGPSLGTRLHGQPFTAPVTQVSFLSLSHGGGNSGPEWLRLAISSQEAAGTAFSDHSLLETRVKACLPSRPHDEGQEALA